MYLLFELFLITDLNTSFSSAVTLSNGVQTCQLTHMYGPLSAPQSSHLWYLYDCQPPTPIAWFILAAAPAPNDGTDLYGGYALPPYFAPCDPNHLVPNFNVSFLGPLRRITAGGVNWGYKRLGPFTLGPRARRSSRPLIILQGFGSTMQNIPPDGLYGVAEGREVCPPPARSVLVAWQRCGSSAFQSSCRQSLPLTAARGSCDLCHV